MGLAACRSAVHISPSRGSGLRAEHARCAGRPHWPCWASPARPQARPHPRAPAAQHGSRRHRLPRLQGGGRRTSAPRHRPLPPTYAAPLPAPLPCCCRRLGRVLVLTAGGGAAVTPRGHGSAGVFQRGHRVKPLQAVGGDWQGQLWRRGQRGRPVHRWVLACCCWLAGGARRGSWGHADVGAAEEVHTAAAPNRRLAAGMQPPCKQQQ